MVLAGMLITFRFEFTVDRVGDDRLSAASWDVASFQAVWLAVLAIGRVMRTEGDRTCEVVLVGTMPRCLVGFELPLSFALHLVFFLLFEPKLWVGGWCWARWFVDERQ